jgi:hypothetical protein
VDVQSERRKKAFNEDVTLEEIRGNCLENLKSFGADDNVVFLISNHNGVKWDFDRLTKAILDGLPHRQKECLTLSLNLLTSLSKDLLKRKVDTLRGNYRVLLNFALQRLANAFQYACLSSTKRGD